MTAIDPHRIDALLTEARREYLDACKDPLWGGGATVAMERRIETLKILREVCGDTAEPAKAKGAR